MPVLTDNWLRRPLTIEQRMAITLLADAAEAAGLIRPTKCASRGLPHASCYGTDIEGRRGLFCQPPTEAMFHGVIHGRVTAQQLAALPHATEEIIEFIRAIQPVEPADRSTSIASLWGEDL